MASTSSTRAASLALLLTLVAAGCGTSRAAKAEKKADCERAAEGLAAFTVARNAFNAGTLGSAKTLAPYFKGRPSSDYLDGGRLRGWDYFAKHTGARFDVDAWMAHLEGSGAPIGQRMYDARMKVRRTGSANC